MPTVPCRFFESEVLPASLQESISWIFPNIRQCFTGRQYHRTRIVETAFSSSSSNASLAPSDLMMSLKFRCADVTVEASDDSTADDLQSQDDGGQHPNQIWSKQALTHAFNCIQLIVS